MAAIERDNDLHTVIVTFTVPGLQAQEQLAKQLREIAADHSRHDGFVSCSILASEDGVRIAEYIQWRSRADWLVAISTPAGKAHVNDPRLVADPHVYRVVDVIERPGGR